MAIGAATTANSADAGDGESGNQKPESVLEKGRKVSKDQEPDFSDHSDFASSLHRMLHVAVFHLASVVREARKKDTLD